MPGGGNLELLPHGVFPGQVLSWPGQICSSRGAGTLFGAPPTSCSRVYHPQKWREEAVGGWAHVVPLPWELRTQHHGDFTSQSQGEGGRGVLGTPLGAEVGGVSP